jgi:hypothetical protein
VGNSSNSSSDCTPIPPARVRRGAMVLASFAIFCLIATVCQAQTHEVVCSAGSGTFVSEFHTGVKVQVTAARSGELATRACKAELNWNKQKLIISPNAPRIDVDAFGVDLGMGVPVVALQVKKTTADCCMSYQIYSLQKPPRLLRTITGADSFSAVDADLDGRVEIWADDSAAVDGFERLDLGQLEFAPPIVLRFTNGQLLDVSAEFQPYFDQQIAKVRAELDARQLRNFKNSDGSVDVQDVKLKVLEIVWSYVYSGREPQAWQSLADMWPASDVDRIRAAILQARSRGIRSQVDGVSAVVPATRKEHAEIFDGIRPAGGGVPTVIPMGRSGRARMLDSINDAAQKKPDLILPEPIQLWAPISMGASQEVVLDLVVDSAGKVRSAAPVDTTKAMDADLLDATTQWKFIPAFKDGRAVASRVRIAVSPER